MTAKAVPASGGPDSQDTANDRLKRSFDSWFWASIIIATVIHFGVFALWPDMTAADVSFTTDELEAIELPPEIEIPPPPEAIQRPATPVVTETNIDEDITIAPTTFEDNPVEDLPPPPDEEGSDLSAGPTFTPMTVRPEIRNRDEVQRALRREYPSILRDSGIGGTVTVWFYIDEAGRVRDTRIAQSSGHKLLDDAALEVAEVYEFTPALNRDKKVPVWVQFPVIFRTR